MSARPKDDFTAKNVLRLTLSHITPTSADHIHGVCLQFDSFFFFLFFFLVLPEITDQYLIITAKHKIVFKNKFQQQLNIVLVIILSLIGTLANSHFSFIFFFFFVCSSSMLDGKTCVSVPIHMQN